MNEPAAAKFERVMIIDDNIIDLYITSRMVTKNNFGNTVLTFPQAQDALDYLKENENNLSQLPQIIFIDIYMPIMSGFEFMADYNELSDVLKNHCRVFILSSTIDDSDIVRAKNDSNISSFQVKPITREFLYRIAVG